MEQHSSQFIFGRGLGVYNVTHTMVQTTYKHLDINCGMIVTQQVNNANKYVLHHAEVPEDDSLVVPHERMYFKLNSVSYSSAQIWIRDDVGSLPMPTIPFEKTRVTLHFRKKLQSM